MARPRCLSFPVPYRGSQTRAPWDISCQKRLLHPWHDFCSDQTSCADITGREDLQTSGIKLTTGGNMEQLIIAFSLSLLISVGSAVIVIQGQRKKRVKPPVRA